MMTPEQTTLLNKMQLIGHPAFKDISPLSMTQDEAAEFFKQNLPHLEYQKAVGITPDKQYEEKIFWGMNEYDCKKQIDHWIEANNYTLDHRPNPYFGSGEDWLKYFSQPIQQVNLKSLEKHFDEWEIKIPKESMNMGNRKVSFSRLELAFDDIDPKKLEYAVKKQKDRDFADLHKITPEQRAEIKNLQAAGKAPAIERSEYLKMDRKAADEYIRQNQNNAENTFTAVSYEKKIPQKQEIFPEYKAVNLIGKYPADYLQKSILRDLVAEGHIATPQTKREFLDKMQFITKEQAEKLIEPHLNTPAGATLVEQCHAYCEFGEIYNSRDVQTIADVQKLYQVNRSHDFDSKAALRDLVDAGYIRSQDAQAKIEYLNDTMGEKLLSRYGDAPMGPRLRAKLMDLVEDGKIGGMEDEQFQNLTVRSAMQIIGTNSRTNRTYSNDKPATDKQKELLQKMEQRGQIDLSKYDMQKITAGQAHALIDANIRTQTQTMTGPATDKQRSMLKILINAEAIPTLKYENWKNLSKEEASQLISSVPEDKRKEILSEAKNERTVNTNYPSRTQKGMEIE